MHRNLIKLFFFIVVATCIAVSCQKETSCENCKSNVPPIAIAGTDQAITLPIDSVVLDGSLSSDPDGTITVWQWKKITGPASLNILFQEKAITTVKNLIAGIYTFELTVKDNGGLTAKDTIEINISYLNRPPVADAGPDQTITMPINTVQVSGAGSLDPDGNITQWFWKQIAGPSQSKIISPSAMQTGINMQKVGVYQFELTVIDAFGLTDKDSININVESPALKSIAFYCPDPTNTLTWYWITFDSPVPPIITVTINNSSQIISGFYCYNCPLNCPLSSNYSAEPGAYVEFNLAAGIYTWKAECNGVDLSPYPAVPSAIIQYFNTLRSKSGTLTVNPGDNCITIPLNF